ncbi:TonB-dependent receptor [Flavobacterium sp. Fl-77]|uniref:TonB-dependent receptor n=1 Tax=Flavobacterium flavipigmentatum TaxID=2893884 RepID=A0AAJ2SDI9_9FLAO|nr:MULTISPECIES: TonB-dependent receptor [unclassified Flavobacterium]MDX6180578.1 TonB-dependent receptor [Flavobacterium sp. Fl-33]MDX6184178.1 TonB-dependent receptor [Flavobacterium sp. Fl-77]UFH39291.1 TonB-dependent receptor [Flavobacterium sp. F-70]
MKFNLKFLSITLFICAISIAQTKGTISGVLTDKEANNQALPFANVLIKGTNISTNTDIDGKYSLTVNPGDYTVIFSFIGYESIETLVTVKANETITVNQTLSSGGYTLKDVVVKNTTSREKETALLLDQKNAVVIKQSIGAQEMSRKGVSDVEEGLTKVTGITKVDGRGLFIRGLEDRYNNLLVNDLQTPSNSPFKKIIPLDLFPTDIVGVLNIYKTFNPNISGDFAGGTVNIETTQPKNITKLNVGFGYTTNNNLKKFLLSDDADTTKGTFGLIGNDRERPSVFGSVPNGKRLSPDEYQSAYGDKNWDVNQTASPLNSSIGFLHSQKFNLEKERNISYIMSFNFDNKYIFREGVDRTFNLGQGNYDNNLYNTQYSYQTTFSGLAGLKYKTNRLNLNFTTLFIQATESKIQDQLGYTNSLTNITNNLIRLNQFEESRYWNTQLFGDYKLTEDGKQTIKAGGSFVKTGFQQPDRKFITGQKINDTEINMSYGGNNLNRQYLDVNGNFYFSALAEYNLKFGDKEKQNNLSIGYNNYLNDMQSTYRFFSGRRNIDKNYTANLNTISSQINDDINNGIVYVQEESNGDYKVKLNQFVNAGYFNLYWTFGEKWDLNAGLRAENSTREIKYREQGDPFGSAYRKKTDESLDLLPSLNTKYALNEKSNLRASLSKTITRPVAMELLPINYINADATSESGNQNLLNSNNYNADFKYELFPNSKELFAIGAFGKLIENPIERVFKPTANSGGQITTFKNSEEAVLYGAEIEMILSLNRISESLSNFTFGFNTSLMSTDVKIDLTKQGNELENSKNRKLQGASNWMINTDLKYDFTLNNDWKNTMTLVYNVYGDRIFAVGSSGIDHIYEKSFSKLDFVWTSNLSKNIELKFAAENLLNPYYRKELGKNSTINITEESLIVRDYKRGVGFSVNLGYTF